MVGGGATSVPRVSHSYNITESFEVIKKETKNNLPPFTGSMLPSFARKFEVSLPPAIATAPPSKFESAQLTTPDPDSSTAAIPPFSRDQPVASQIQSFPPPTGANL